MKMQKKTYVIELADGINAKYSLERVGQQPPAQGDGVVVLARIMLPALKHGSLIYEIRFGERLKLAGESLDFNWGAAGDAYRYRTEEFVATKWSEAFANAAAWARSELHKLAEALTVRAKALEDAER